MSVLNVSLLLLIGLAGGIAVGAGLVAFLVVLDIVPRLTQITRTKPYLTLYQHSIIVGAVFWTWFGMRDMHFSLHPLFVALFGLFAGIFVGMLAAALTEVLNVLPILAKRMYMVESLVWLMMAMLLGKVCGSLFQWLFFAL